MKDSPITILVVDDEYSSLEVLVLLLEQQGYVVVSASDGVEALAKLPAATPDLVLTDYMMPKMNGLELCERMRRDDGMKNIPVILMSGSFSGDLDGTQVISFLRKPFLFDRLMEKIRHALKR